jgi:hypothetical protein
VVAGLGRGGRNHTDGELLRRRAEAHGEVANQSDREGTEGTGRMASSPWSRGARR